MSRTRESNPTASDTALSSRSVASRGGWPRAHCSEGVHIRSSILDLNPLDLNRFSTEGEYVAATILVPLVSESDSTSVTDASEATTTDATIFTDAHGRTADATELEMEEDSATDPPAETGNPAGTRLPLEPDSRQLPADQPQADTVTAALQGGTTTEEKPQDNTNHHGSRQALRP